MLIVNSEAILTGDRSSPIAHGSIRVEGAQVTAVGELLPEPGEATFDARGCVVTPGWVNTHHHFFQSLLKLVPEALDQPLATWSPAVPGTYRGAFGEEDFRVAVQVALVEMLLSGVTTTADQHYLYYPRVPFDGAAIIFEEAARFGMRMVLCRGGMTVNSWKGTELPQWLVPETVDDFLADVERLVSQYHDPSPTAMRRIAIAPTTLTSRTRADHLRAMADAGRALGVKLHSHLAETMDDELYCREHYCYGLLDLCERTGWLGDDVWFAHMVHLSASDIARLGEARVGMSHCPASNARLGTGIADVEGLEQAGVRVSMAVDGAASNESADMLSELHFGWLAHRTRGRRKPDGSLHAPSHLDLVRWATSGGADVVGLDTGVLAPGFPADLCVFRPRGAGPMGVHDPVASLVASAAQPQVELLMCNGRVLCEAGDVVGLDLEALRARAAQATARIRRSAGVPL